MNSYSSTKVLVTGSDGIIGKFIAESLEKEGYLVGSEAHVDAWLH